MDIAQRGVELFDAVNVAIVKEALPERSSKHGQESSTDDLLQHLDGDGKLCPFRFVQQQVDMLRHDNVSVDGDSVPEGHPFQSCFC